MTGSIGVLGYGFAVVAGRHRRRASTRGAGHAAVGAFLGFAGIEAPAMPGLVLVFIAPS